MELHHLSNKILYIQFVLFMTLEFLDHQGFIEKAVLVPAIASSSALWNAEARMPSSTTVSHDNFLSPNTTINAPPAQLIKDLLLNS